MAEIYDFPVALHDITTVKGKVIKNQKALVREDTQDVISIVSNNYQVFTHKEVIDKATHLFLSIGQPHMKYFMTKGGASLVAVAEYRDIREDVGVGDAIGLRVYMENSYNKTRGISFFIGGIVLSCMNGMVSSESIDTLRFRHTRNQIIELPSIDDILRSWSNQVSTWKSYQNMLIPIDMVKKVLVRKRIADIVTVKDREKIIRGLEPNSEGEVIAWDLHQAITANVTHQREKLSQIGKIIKLRRLSAAFHEFIFPIREV